MNKSIKKLLAVLLSLVMVFSLAGCGNKKDNPGDETTPTVGGTQEDNATPTEEAAAEQYPAFDFGGRTIKVGVWWDQYYTSDHTAITDDPGMSNSEVAQLKLDNVRRIEEKYNCKIQYVNLGWDGIKESINTSIAAGSPECDIYFADLQFAIPAIVNGLVQDLSTFAPKTSDVLGKQTVVKSLDVLGGNYLFMEQGINTSGMFLGYNSTMIEDLGLKDPQELWRNGEWTWEKFAEYAQAGTQDTDNDGTIDVYGYGGVFTDLIPNLIMNNGGTIAGTETEGLSSKSSIEALELVDRLYNKDKSARPWNPDDWADNLLSWSSGKVMFWGGQVWSIQQETRKAADAGNPLPFEYHVVPYPSGPSGDGKAYSPLTGNWNFIPVGVKEPEKVYQIFEEYLNWYNFSTEIRDDMSKIESAFLTQEDIDIALITAENQKLDIWGSMSPNFDLGAAIWDPIIIKKDATVAQAVEAAKPVLQDALDAFYKK